jgi:protein gp37
MAGNSAIEWTHKTWNPLAGCTRVSPGCDNCYAAKMSLRLEGMAKAAEKAGKNPGGSAKYIGVATRNKQGTAVFNGTINLDHEALTQPLRWTKPVRIFVNSMSDLFHKDVPFSFVEQVFAVMDKAPHHTYQVLTKRPERAVEFYRQYYPQGTGEHIWMGTSVENQEVADERIPHLLKIPAAVRFLSCEPLLGPVDLTKLCVDEWYHDCLSGVGVLGGTGTDRVVHWVIVGGESGPNARPMHPDWARSIRDQCQATGVAFHFKQWGEWGFVPDGVLILKSDPIKTEDGSFVRFGKKVNGRKLDSREWNEFPGGGG